MPKIHFAADNDRGQSGAAWQVWLGGAVIVLAAFAAFSNSFDGEFVYDDFISVKNNPYIQRLWPLSDAMSLPMINNGATVSRRPLLSLSFALNRYFLGAAPWGFHLVNLSIHIIAALLLFGIVRRTLLLAAAGQRIDGRYGRQALPMALAVAVIWLVHPLQVESVTYIVQRAESLMGMLFLLAVYASLRGFQSSRPLNWYLLAVLACAAGMAVKEVMFTAPIIIFLYDGALVSTSYRAAWQTRRRFYAALASTWIVLAVFQIMGFEDMSQDFTGRSPLRYALTQPGVMLYYLKLCVWPAPLVLDYGWPSADSLAAIAPAGCLILLLLTLTARALYQRRWQGLVGAWFFLILGPSSSFAALSQNLQPHRMYLSLAAVVLLLTALGESLIRRLLAGRRGSYRGVACLSLVTITVLFTLRTRFENTFFHDEAAVWRHNIELRPGSTKARGFLGALLFNRGDLAGALVQFHEIVARQPDSAGAHATLGNALFLQGDSAAAIAEHETALRIDSRFWLAHLNLGTIYLKQNQRALAIQHFREVTVILRRGKKIDYYFPGEILEIRHNAHLTLATLLLEQGQREAAIEHLQSALQLRPDSHEARQLLHKISGAA